MTTRIGVLTGGGDCPGLNAAIRAVTLYAHGELGWDVVGIHNGYEGLYDERYIELTPASVQHLLSRGGTVLGSSNRANPFAYRVKLPDGRSEIHDVSARCLANLRGLDLKGLVVIGGDGTMGFAQRFIERGATHIVGVPKTIDNDLAATDYTIGFQTAVDIVVEAVERLASTAESHERIMVVEVMGRYAGWIALTAGLAGGAHVVLIPEIEYDPTRLIEAFRRRHARGESHSIVVVAEGARPIGGARAVAVAGDVTHQERLGGEGAQVAALIARETDYEVRSIVLGHVQRGGSPCAFDRELATKLGVKAVDLVETGQFGQLAVIERGVIGARPIADAVKNLKLVDRGGALVHAARSVGIELGG